MSIETVKRVSIAMSRCLAFQVSDPIGRREVANGKTHRQLGLHFFVTVHTIETPQPDQLHPIKTTLGSRSK